MSGYCGRFAPSPTGDLHLGSAATALVTWLCARAAGGRLILRVEDIDRPRVLPDVEARQLDDLRWLELDWDEGPDVGGPHAPYRQSERDEYYLAALAQLASRDLLFACDCSRRDIARVASAPHGEDGPRYPGTCRGRRADDDGPWKRPPATRLTVAPGEILVDDPLQGRLVQDVASVVGDFVLRRGDGIWAYQLAVVVDDLAMGVTEIVRGADLLTSTPRQVLLAQLLGGTLPAVAHAPLVLGPDGARLAKRAGGMTIREHRDGGRTAQDIVGLLAHVLGLRPTAEPIDARALLPTFDRRQLSGRPSVRLAADLTPRP